MSFIEGNLYGDPDRYICDDCFGRIFDEPAVVGKYIGFGTDIGEDKHFHLYCVGVKRDAGE